MVTKVQRWGNSQGLRLARQVLEDARIAVGDDVDVVARDGMIVIAPVRRSVASRAYKNWCRGCLKGTSPKKSIGASRPAKRYGK